MKKEVKKLFLASLTLASAFIFSACSKNEAVSQKPNSAPEVTVALPEKRAVEIWDSFTARLEGNKEVEIRARVSGYLSKICFKDGEFVKEGQLLFEIDPRPFIAVVKECEASIKEAESRIILAKGNLKRAEELIKTNAISGEVLETRKCELLSAQAALLSAQARHTEAALNLEFTKVLSPITGFVSRRYVDEGNLVNASSTLLATVVSRKIIYAYFNINERDILRYQKNGLFKRMKSGDLPVVKMKLLDEEIESHVGKLTYVQNEFDMGNLELRAEFDNEKGELFPGVWSKVSLQSEKAKEKILVPESSVGTDLVGRYVLVVDDKNKVNYVPVRVSETIGKMQIVESGLSGDEKVVVVGIQRAVPGAQVSPVEAKVQDVVKEEEKK
ncbi:MAG: efflux RND transporter periplasmic adaptor subunit [Opitutales bacterium]|nr:efflux RND transporter periplasmic adaptor subunit [Opitutales bacterium]